MHRRNVLTSLASLTALSLAATPLMAQTTPMGDGSVIRLMTSPAGTQSFPPFVIERFGLDEKYGFQLEIVPSGNSTATINGMVSGAAEMAIFDWVTLSRLRVNEVPVIGVVPFVTYVNTVIVPADSPATTVADLAGMRIGALNVKSFDWIMLTAAALAAGVDLTEGSEVIEGAPTLMRGMLEQGQLDVILQYGSLTPDTVLDGRFRVMATIRDLALAAGLPEMSYLLYAANSDWAAANPDNVAAFAAAYRESVEILLTDDQVWVDQAVGNMGMNPASAELMRDQLRTEFMTHFSDDQNEVYQTTFDTLFPIAGEEVFGFSQMPAAVVTMDFN